MPSSVSAITREELVHQLHALGVQPGGVLLVHTSFSRVRPVEGGPVGLIEALRTVLGPHGTLVMPAMADDDEHPFVYQLGRERAVVALFSDFGTGLAHSRYIAKQLCTRPFDALVHPRAVHQRRGDDPGFDG